MTVIQPNSISGVTSITAQVSDISIFSASSGFANITAGNISAAGTITYEDVTNVDSVGVITARSGINLTGGSLTIPDSIIHSGDTNTKIRFPAADTITAETGGTERLRIFSDGKFGFGTNSLSETTMAEFSSSTGGGAIGSNITIRNSSTNSVNNIAELRLKTAHGVARIFKYNTSETVFMSHHGGASDLIMQADGASNFKVNTNASERLRIGSAGQLGIGGANYGSSGQVLTSQGSGSAVQWATPTGGKILQVVNVYKGDRFTTSSTSWADITGLSIAITPSSTSSKIMLSCSMGAAGTRINNGDYGNGIRVMRDIGGGGYSNNNKLNGAADGSRDRITFKGHGWSYNSDHMPGGVGFTGVDDPNTTSAVTYKVQVICQSSSYAFFLNGNTTNGDNSSIAQARSQTSLIAMEIGG